MKNFLNEKPLPACNEPNHTYSDKVQDKNVEDLSELIQERAAIREYDGGQSRIKAENGAIKEVVDLKFNQLNEIERDTLLDVFRTLLGWSRDLDGGKK